jgi:hypothetical protein
VHSLKPVQFRFHPIRLNLFRDESGWFLEYAAIATPKQPGYFIDRE